jgi:hypothetical protein
MQAGRYWHPGDQILLRYRRRGPVSFAYPVTVVHDDADHIALYLRPSTPVRRRVMPDGSPIPRNLPYAEAVNVPHLVGHGTWDHNHTLIIAREGDPFDIRLFWAEVDWVFRGWYVNLQDPLRRVPVGFDTADHVLDIEANPDRQWSWKDEHEMAEAIRIGRFSQAEAEAIRAAGESVIPAIEAHRWPFDQSLTGWRPDAAWPIPTVPDTWNDD